MKHLVLMAAVLTLGLNVWAKESRFKVYKEDSDHRAAIGNDKPLSVYYEKISWNQDPTKIESGYMYLRDRDTGHLFEMKLTETEPDSGVFNVNFPIGVLEKKRIATEIYSAPQSMLKGGDRLGLMKDFISDGSVKRKPFLLRVLREKGQIVDIFDDKAKAIAAYNKYRKEMGLSPESTESESIIEIANQQKVQKKKMIDTSTLQSMFLANENDLEASNEKNLELREVMKNMEEKRRQQVQSNAKSWTAVQAKINLNESNQLIKEAVEEIKTSKFESSQEKFFKSSDLAPFNEDLYEQYGVSLFRNNKFNQAIVVLELSQPSASRLPEKLFYIGLSYYRLKDYARAIEAFDKVMASGDENFAPTAAFYKGSALLEIHEYDQSKEAFQYVLDHSKNPEMDKRAEQFIEYALDQKTLSKKRSNWFGLDGVLGLMYDSNIILANDQILGAGDVTNVNGWRLLAQIAPKFRPYYSNTDEVNIRLNYTTLKSYNTSFGSNPTAQTADPVVMSATVPWTHRGTLGGKGYYFDLSPGYETISMDLDGTGMATIANSIKLNFNNTLVVSKNWIAKADWAFYQKDANILGDETSADAFGAGMKLSSIVILNKDLERYFIPEFGYRLNNAKASNYAFYRVDLAATFTTSIFDTFVWNNRAGYYLANYESIRTDNNYSVSSGVNAKISANWNWGLVGSYIINDSTTNRYKKYNFMTTFSFAY